MNGFERPSQLDEHTRRRLTRLADCSLRASERAELEARLAESPELRAALDRQPGGVKALRRLDLEAPPALRARVDAQTTARRRPSRRLTWRVAGALAGAAAIAVVLAVFLFPAGSGNPTVREASRLALRPATASVAVDRSNPKLLAANVEGVPFPSWAKEFGWRQAGTRTDALDSRDSRTVFYERHGRRVAYTIVSGDGIHAPSGAGAVTANGVSLHTLTDERRRVVTWWRHGRTCVLTSADVGDGELVRLASWKGDGAVPF